MDGGVMLCQPPETATGIRKCLEICLHDDRPALTLRHPLHNEGLWAVQLPPLGWLEPGQSVTHTERWELHPG